MLTVRVTAFMTYYCLIIIIIIIIIICFSHLFSQYFESMKPRMNIAAYTCTDSVKLIKYPRFVKLQFMLGIGNSLKLEDI